MASSSIPNPDDTVSRIQSGASLGNRERLNRVGSRTGSGSTGRRIVSAVLVVLSSLPTAGCDDDPPAPTRPAVRAPARVELNPVSFSLPVGGQGTIVASVRDASGALLPASIAWSASDETIATVSGGVVRALRAGSTTIQATAGGVGAIAAVSVTGPSSVPARLDVAPSRADLQVGGTQQFYGLARDNAGIALPDAPTWSSADPTIATVSPSGLVTALRVGSTTVTARTGQVSAVALVTVSAANSAVTIQIDNKLLARVSVSVAGQSLGTVPRSETRQVEVARANTITLSWEVVEPVLNGRLLGDRMAGTFTLSNPGSTVRLEINNLVGSQSYFAPIVTNNATVPLAMMTNGGLQSENRCDCVVPANSSSVFIGYYLLYSNSNVRAFRSGMNYTGAYWEFFNFTNRVEPASGAVTFTLNSAP